MFMESVKKVSLQNNHTLKNVNNAEGIVDHPCFHVTPLNKYRIISSNSIQKDLA